MTRAEILQRMTGRPRKTSERSESEIQAGILSYLAMRRDMYAWRNNSGGYFPAPGRFLRFGERGSADILCIQAPVGRLIGIEVKRPGKKPTVYQAGWGKKVQAKGGVYFVVSSVAELKEALGDTAK